MAEGEVIYKIRGDNSQLPNDLKKAEQIIGNSAQTVEKAAGMAIKAVGAAAAAAGTAATAIGTAALQSADSLDKAVNHVVAATGASEGAVKKYEDVIKGVYSDNFGESFEDIANSISKITQNLGEMDEVTLQNVTERAYALQDVFDMGVDESSRAAKAMSKNFGISASDAYDYIAKGAQDGLDYSGELLDSINEYSVQFAKLGFSADDMFNIFAQGAENGAWNLDKIGDAVKEFSIRAIDGSDTTRAGFQAIGYDADDMMKKFAAGGDIARDAFQTVVSALAEMEDPIARDAAGVNLFGTMWEDLGVEAVAALGNISDSAYDCKGAMDGIMEVNYDSLSDALEGLKRQTEMLIQPLGDELIPLVEGVIERLSEIANDVAPVLIKAAEPMITSMLKMIDPLSQLIVELLPPLIEIVGDIAAKISDFVVKHIPALTSALKNAVDFIGKAIKVAWEFKDVIAAIVTAFISFKAAIAIGNAVSAAVTAIRSFKTITDAATASQLALNAAGAANPYVLIASLAAGAIGGITAFINNTETAADRVNTLRSEVDSLNKAAKQSEEAAKDVRKLVDEYKDIKSSVDGTKEAKDRLEEIQNTLINTYDAEAGKLDLINGKYSEQLGLITQIADKKYEDAKRDATVTYNKYLELEKLEKDIIYSRSSHEMDGFLTYSYRAMALRDSQVRDLFEKLSKENENISFDKEAVSLGGYDDYKISVSGDTTEKYKAYHAIVKAFEETGLDKAGGDISKFYSDYVDLYNQYEDAYTINEQTIKDYDKYQNEAPDDRSSGDSDNHSSGNPDVYTRGIRSPTQIGGGVRLNTELAAEAGYDTNGNKLSTDQEEEETVSAPATYSYTPYIPQTTASNSPTAGMAGGSGRGQFVSVTSYVPTMWDSDQTAALKSLIGKDVLGNTATAHQINELTGAISMSAQSTADSGETNLADVVNAISKLQKRVDTLGKDIGDITIELKARDLTIGKAAVRDINDMAKQSGKSPFKF